MTEVKVDPLCELKHETILVKLEASERHNRERCDLIVEKLEERLKGMDTALGLKSDEIGTKLRDLNHVRRESMEERQHMLRKDTYDAKIEVYDIWIAGVNDRLTRIETRSAVWATVIILAFAAVEVFMHFTGK